MLSLYLAVLDDQSNEEQFIDVCVGWCFVAICSTVTVYCSYSVFGNLYEIFKIARYAIRTIKERT